MPMPDLEIADAVRELRQRRHLSQSQLAQRMQVPRSYISKIENRRTNPSLISLERLADALNVDVSCLLRDTRSHRDREIAAIMADPFLAEVALLLPSLDSLRRAVFFGSVRDMARGRRRLSLRVA